MEIHHQLEGKTVQESEMVLCFSDNVKDKGALSRQFKNDDGGLGRLRLVLSVHSSPYVQSLIALHTRFSMLISSPRLLILHLSLCSRSRIIQSSHDGRYSVCMSHFQPSLSCPHPLEMLEPKSMSKLIRYARSLNQCRLSCAFA